MSREFWKESLWTYNKDQLLKCRRKLQEGRGSYRLDSEGSATHDARSQALSLFPQTRGSLSVPSFVQCIFTPTSRGGTQESTRNDVFLCIFFCFLGYLFLAFWGEIQGLKNPNNFFSGRWISPAVVHFQRSVLCPRSTTPVTLTPDGDWLLFC